MDRRDVIILGAGVAGLAAAERLGKAGLRVLILEARDRVGGRIYSLPGLSAEHSIELGAEFVHGKPKLLDDYLQSHKLKLFETNGQSYCMEDDRLKPCSGPATRVFDKLDKLDPHTFPDESFDDAVKRFVPNLPEEEKRWARSFVQGFHAADPSQISTHSIIVGDHAEEETEGDRGFHIAGGYRRLVEALCADLSGTVEIRTAAVVTDVEWNRDVVGVRARFPDGKTFEYEAPQVVVTLPLGVLQQKPPSQHAVRFDPPLVEKQGALAKLAMGPVVRVTLEFDSVFWEDRAIMGDRVLRDLHFLFSRDPVFPTFWSAMPLRLPVLVAWSAGPLAAAKAHLPHEAIAIQTLLALSRILALPESAIRARFVRSHFHDWQADPFSQGAYSYVLAGGMAAQEELARPLGKRLFFAGEATQSDGHHATVHGAFSSGWRVAREVLER